MLTKEQVIEVAARVGSISLNATRVHEISGPTRTIFNDAGLVEFAAAVERAVLAQQAGPDEHMKETERLVSNVSGAAFSEGMAMQKWAVAPYDTELLDDQVAKAAKTAKARDALVAHLRTLPAAPGESSAAPGSPSATAPAPAEPSDAMDAANANGLAWAVSRWDAEVSNRPLVNVHRRTLDDCWRQVVRYFGGNPDKLLGASHDTLLAASTTNPQGVK